MLRYVAILFVVIFAVVSAYDPVYDPVYGGGVAPQYGGGAAPQYEGGGAPQYGGGGAPQYKGDGSSQYGGSGAPQYGGGVDHYYGGQDQPVQYGYDYYKKHCPCSKSHKKIDFVFVIKLVTKNYKPRGQRRRNYFSIHTDVLAVCQNDKKKKPFSRRGSSQPMARLETLKNVGAGCGPFDGMREGKCYIVRGYTTKPSRYRYFNIDQCHPPERVHCGYPKCPYY